MKTFLSKSKKRSTSTIIARMLCEGNSNRILMSIAIFQFESEDIVINHNQKILVPPGYSEFWCGK